MFYNEFGSNEIAQLNVNLSGTLNNLQVDELNVSTSRNTKIKGDINFKNLFNAEENNFEMNANFSNLTSNYRDLKTLMPNILGASIPSSFEKLGSFTIKGRSEITSKIIKTNTSISTELGFIDSQLQLNRIDDIDNAFYKGKLIFSDFLIGKFLNNDKLGMVSFNLDVEGNSFILDKMNTKAQGDIFSFNIMVMNIEIWKYLGTFENKKFNGEFIANDENLNLNFNGLADLSKEIYNFDFIANVKYADLKALNLLKEIVFLYSKER